MCYHIQNEVRIVQKNETMTDEELAQQAVVPREGYRPRPRYQVWAARFGLVVVIVAVALYYYYIAKGGN